MDNQKFMGLQNELTNILKFARDMETLLCHSFDWLIKRLGYCNIGIWLSGEEDDEFLLGAYMKHTVPDEHGVTDTLKKEMQWYYLKKDTFTKADGSKLDHLDSRFAGHQFVFFKCNYIDETLALVAVFQQKKPGETFSQDQVEILEIFQALFPVALATVVRGDDMETGFEEPHPENKKSDPADWWKRGEAPPF